MNESSIYELFISYSEDDSVWVEEILLPQLGLADEQIITEERFRPGADKVDEFVRAVTSSRYTVLVFSHAFLQNVWATYTGRIAKYFSVEQQNSHFIPLLRQDCNLPTIARTLVPLDFRNDAKLEQEMTRLRELLRVPMPALKVSLAQPNGQTDNPKRNKSNLIPSSSVPQSLVAFRSNFKAACQQIERLGYYKELHDLLQNIQIHCYDIMLIETRQLPINEEEVWENLKIHELTLQYYLSKLQQITNGEAMLQREVNWIQDLFQAHNILDEAIKQVDKKWLSRALRLMKRVLDREPSRITERLNATVRALRFDDLRSEIEGIRHELLHLEPNLQENQQFASDIHSFTSLITILSPLIDYHDGWQAVEVEFVGIEAIVPGEPEILGEFWQRLQNMVDPLCRNSRNYSFSTDWVERFNRERTYLDIAIARWNTNGIKSRLPRYRRLANMHFLDVDTQLKKRCDELRQVGESLNKMLGMII